MRFLKCVCVRSDCVCVYVCVCVRVRVRASVCASVAKPYSCKDISFRKAATRKQERQQTSLALTVRCILSTH